MSLESEPLCFHIYVVFHISHSLSVSSSPVFLEHTTRDQTHVCVQKHTQPLGAAQPRYSTQNIKALHLLDGMNDGFSGSTFRREEQEVSDLALQSRTGGGHFSRHKMTYEGTATAFVSILLCGTVAELSLYLPQRLPHELTEGQRPGKCRVLQTSLLKVQLCKIRAEICRYGHCNVIIHSGIMDYSALTVSYKSGVNLTTTVPIVLIFLYLSIIFRSSFQCKHIHRLTYLKTRTRQNESASGFSISIKGRPTSNKTWGQTRSEGARCG